MTYTICKFPGCDNKIKDADKYCTLHKDEEHNFKRRNKNDRWKVTGWEYLYNSHRWRKLKSKIIERDQYCQICGSEHQLVVDHIQPHRGDTNLFYDEANLIVLCKVCHDKKTRAEIESRK